MHDSGDRRRDQVSRVIDAPLARVFAALVDVTALEVWLPPHGMTAAFERFDPRLGGADSDIVEARYVDIVHAADDHAAGMGSSLEQLARYLEA